MRNKLLTAILAPLFLISSCAIDNNLSEARPSPLKKCTKTKYVYKEGEHPEKIAFPELPTKPTPIDFTLNDFGPNNKFYLSPYGNSNKISQKHYIAGVEQEIKNVEINIYPSVKDNWIEKIQTEEEKILVAEYEIILSEEIKNLEPIYEGLSDEPHVIYHGPEEKRNSVYKKLGEGFKQSYVIDGKFFPFYPKSYGDIGNASKIYKRTIENLLEKEMEISE